MNVNHRAKTVNMFVYDSQEMSETLFLPPLFLVLSADQIPDSATMVDPNRSHVGRLNSPVQNLWEDGITLALVCYSSSLGPESCLSAVPNHS